MFRNRAFLFGLGSGIIFGAVLFQLMLFGVHSRENLEHIDSEINEKLYTQADVDALLKSERDSAQIDKQTNIDSNKLEEPTPVPSEPPVEEQTAASSKQTDPDPDKEANAPHLIQIKAGSGLTDTAELLAENRIIQDQAAFIKGMKESKKLVRAGIFLFNEDITVMEAIKIVSSQPLTKEQAEAIKAIFMKD